jgi:hypothetical protein
MTPDECKRSVEDFALLLERRVARREINASVIPTLLADVARDAARHNGIPEAWRNYLPERYSNDT